MKFRKMSEHQTETKLRLLFFATEDWYFAMHFLHFAVAAQDRGWEVVLICNTGQKGEAALKQIIAAGIKTFPVKLARTSITPIGDLKAFLKICSFIRKWQPQLIHAIALKPIIFSSVYSVLAKIPVINMMTGLGFVFTSASLKARLLQPLLSRLLRLIFANRTSRLIVLNKEDAMWAEKTFKLISGQLEILPGVGIDTNRFSPGASEKKVFTIAYVGRMLKDKGLFELIESSVLLKQKGLEFKLRLAGAPDPSNPESISEKIIEDWQNQGLCDYLGHITDIPGFLREADIMVLPSYREGMPTCILEAAAVGIPCIATDVPGCREAVMDGITGLLVPARNPGALADAINKLALDRGYRLGLGNNARNMILDKYSQQLVLAKMLRIYEDSQKVAKIHQNTAH
ncbi:MAG: glycosyltransferase family 1 protein [Candidatus Riflebacteria bacterium HGW-Riflebacteria-2]|jgi:glycosyltransferase involved in cell wall biosynthesis|nr:MAG: glycosyltransferase family 1 protein [Candidatus Riflebacteria bacterium HGW-Riflebacteria-2]